MGKIQVCGQAFVLNNEEIQNRKGQYFLVTEMDLYNFKRIFILYYLSVIFQKHIHDIWLNATNSFLKETFSSCQ